jgi:hypothetical protein
MNQHAEIIKSVVAAIAALVTLWLFTTVMLSFGS